MPAGPFVMGTSDDPGPTTTSGPRTRCRRAGVLDRHAPVANRAYRAFVEAGGYDDPRWWTPDGLGVAQRAGSGAPAFWLRDGGRLAAAPVRPDRAAARRRAGAARLLVRGRRLRPVGRPAAAHRGRVGEGGPLGPGHRPTRRLPVGRRRPRRREHANLGQRHLGPPRSAPIPAGASPLRRAADDRRRVGVDVAPTSPATPASRLPLPRVLRGVLRRRLQGAARRLVGHRPGRLPGARSATGTSRSAGRSSPASAPRGTPDVCRHLAWLGPPRDARVAAPRRRRTRCSSSPARRGASARRGQRRRLRRRLVRPDVEPSRRATAGHTDLDRLVVRRRWPRRRPRGACSAAVRDATPASPRPTRPRAAPFTDGPWLFSHNGALRRLAARPASRCSTAACRDPRTAATRVGLRAAVRALVRDRLRAGASLGDGARRTVVGRSPRRAGPAQPAAHRRRRHRGHRLRRHAVYLPRAAAGRARGVRAARRRPRLARRPRPARRCRP